MMPLGESQLTCVILIMIIITNTELKECETNLVNSHIRDYLLSSSVVVLSQVPDEVRAWQDFKVSLLCPPPHATIFSWLWLHIGCGRSGNLQWWPVDGTKTDIFVLPDISNPEYIK